MKKPADAILALIPKGKGDEDDGDYEDSEDEGSSEEKKRAAGEELASALKSGDGLKIANAMEDMLAICGY